MNSKITALLGGLAARSFKTALLLAALSAPALAFLAGCASPQERSSQRQEGRVQGRTQHRQEERRGW